MVEEVVARPPLGPGLERAIPRQERGLEQEPLALGRPEGFVPERIGRVGVGQAGSHGSRMLRRRNADRGALVRRGHAGCVPRREPSRYSEPERNPEPVRWGRTAKRTLPEPILQAWVLAIPSPRL